MASKGKRSPPQGKRKEKKKSNKLERRLGDRRRLAAADDDDDIKWPRWFFETQNCAKEQARGRGGEVQSKRNTLREREGAGAAVFEVFVWSNNSTRRGEK